MSKTLVVAHPGAVSVKPESLAPVPSACDVHAYIHTCFASVRVDGVERHFVVRPLLF